MINLRNRIPAVLSAALCFMFIHPHAQGADAQEKKAINLSSAQGLPFSDGILVGNTLYLAGQQGTDATGKLEEGISEQTRAALETIRKVVTRAGFSLKDVVTVNVYLSDVHDFGAMNKVYATFFPDPKPTRTTIQAAALVNGAKIEISAIAVRR
jgi:2-iminobutanoate/2-iminopropanoate deaminase